MYSKKNVTSKNASKKCPLKINSNFLENATLKNTSRKPLKNITLKNTSKKCPKNDL